MSDIWARKSKKTSKLSWMWAFCSSVKQTNPMTPTTVSLYRMGVLISKVSSQDCQLGQSAQNSENPGSRMTRGRPVLSTWRYTPLAEDICLPTSPENRPVPATR